MADIRYGEQGLQNFTPLMTLVEREENMLERMGLFSVDFSDQELTTFERINAGTDNMYSVARGADRQYAGDDVAKTAHVQIPFFIQITSARPGHSEITRLLLIKSRPSINYRQINFSPTLPAY